MVFASEVFLSSEKSRMRIFAVNFLDEEEKIKQISGESTKEIKCINK